MYCHIILILTHISRTFLLSRNCLRVCLVMSVTPFWNDEIFFPETVIIGNSLETNVVYGDEELFGPYLIPQSFPFNGKRHSAFYVSSEL